MQSARKNKNIYKGTQVIADAQTSTLELKSRCTDIDFRIKSRCTAIDSRGTNCYNQVAVKGPTEGMPLRHGGRQHGYGPLLRSRLRLLRLYPSPAVCSKHVSLPDQLAVEF